MTKLTTQESANLISERFDLLKQSILGDKRDISIYREDFISECIDHINSLVNKKSEDTQNISRSEIITGNIKSLRVVRNYVYDWILLENENSDTDDLADNIIRVINELISIQPEINKVSWLYAYLFFIYETFLYVVAALIHIKAYTELNKIYRTDYSLLYSKWHDKNDRPTKFTQFYLDNNSVGGGRTSEDEEFFELIRKLIIPNVDRSDISSKDIKQADFLTFFTSLLIRKLVIPNTDKPKIQSIYQRPRIWYPRTLLGKDFPLFQADDSHNNLKALAIITGVKNIEDVKDIENLESEIIQSYKNYSNPCMETQSDPDSSIASLLNIGNSDTSE